MDNIKLGRIVPHKLLRRISRLIKVDDVLYEDSSTLDQNDVLDENESLDDTKICVELRSNPNPLYHIETNWIEEYIKTVRKDRVKWESKLYASDREFSNKTMFEQVEELMDVSAEDFAECINKLSDDKQHHVSKEMIKQLFSIDMAKDISRSIHVKKVHKPIVSEVLGNMFGCPEVSIEENISKINAQNNKAFKVKPKYHAFGRCLSPKSKRVKAIKFSEPEPIAFPEDIQSGKNLFKGIDHLKSTKALLNYLDENNLPKPKYLTDMDALNRKSNEIRRHTPLHSFYQ